MHGIAFRLFFPFLFLSLHKRYSTDDLLRALSQSVLALVKIVLQHHNNTTANTPPASPTASSTTAIPILISPTPPLSPTSSAPPPLAPIPHTNGDGGAPALPRSNSNGRLEAGKKGDLPLRYAQFCLFPLVIYFTVLFGLFVLFVLCI
jgi:hypothetical protein